MSEPGRKEYFTIRLEDEELAALERYAAAHGVEPMDLSAFVAQLVAERIASWETRGTSGVRARQLAGRLSGAETQSELAARIEGARGSSGLVNGPRHEVLRLLVQRIGDHEIARRLRVSEDVLAGWVGGWRAILGDEWIGVERLARDYLEGVLHGPS